MAISKALLSQKQTKNRCLICNSEVQRATIGHLCNSCKDSFASMGAPKISIGSRFAM